MNWEKKFTNWIGSKSSVIVHTVIFLLAFCLPFFGVKLDTVLLVLTTLVSLEAIYLAIFIQISVNENTQSLHEVEEDIEEIQHDVDEIQEDVDEIQEDVEDIQIDAEEDTLDGIRDMLKKLLEEVDRLKKK
jgi:peptidoglycan hydrolase CwlO-like protein